MYYERGVDMLSAAGSTITVEVHSINNKASGRDTMLCNRYLAPSKRQSIGRVDLRHVACTESKPALGEEELQDAGKNANVERISDTHDSPQLLLCRARRSLLVNCAPQTWPSTTRLCTGKTTGKMSYAPRIDTSARSYLCV